LRADAKADIHPGCCIVAATQQNFVFLREVLLTCPCLRGKLRFVRCNTQRRFPFFTGARANEYRSSQSPRQHGRTRAHPSNDHQTGARKRASVPPAHARTRTTVQIRHDTSKSKNPLDGNGKK
jgi:hypothetical protein